jgi:hypothetical protein
MAWSFKRAVHVALRDQQRVVSSAEWDEVLRRWGPVCAWRGIYPHECTGGLQRGHHRAHARLGRSSVTNTAPECANFNQMKGSLSTWRVLRDYCTVPRQLMFGLRYFMANVIRSTPGY